MGEIVPQEFVVPMHDLLQVAKMAPATWADLLDIFEGWLTDGGQDSRQAYFIRCARYNQHPLPKDIARLDTVMAIMGGVQPWIGDQLADLDAFVTFGRSLATETLLTEDVSFADSKSTVRKALIDARIALFVRWRDLFKRQYDTLSNRIKTGQTLSANARGGGGGPAHAGHRP